MKARTELIDVYQEHDELIKHILSFVDYKDIVQFGKTSKRYNNFFKKIATEGCEEYKSWLLDRLLNEDKPLFNELLDKGLPSRSEKYSSQTSVIFLSINGKELEGIDLDKTKHLYKNNIEKKWFIDMIEELLNEYKKFNENNRENEADFGHNNQI